MGTGYTRNDSTNNIANGNVINASDLDGEFDAIQTAFSTSGHTHDGTAAEGGVITVVGPAQEFLGDGTAWYPKTDATYDLGKSTASFDVAFIESINLGGTAITASATEINYIDGVTSNIQTQLGTKLPLAGGTMTGNLLLGDNDKAIFGAGSDLQIYHDGSDNSSYIKESGSGNLKILGAGIILKDDSDTNVFINCTASTGQVNLRYGGDEKLKTLNTGIDVTGNVTVSGTVDGRDVATDGTKLDGIEDNAKNDQTITAGSGLSGGGTGDVSLSHADTSSVSNSDNSGNTFIQDITFDTYGHVQSVGTGTVSVGNGTLTVQGTGALGGSGTFTANQSGNATISISHDDTSSQASVNGSGRTYIQDVTLDTYGHVTGLATATETVTDTTYSVGDGGLTQKNFTTTLKTKLDGIASGAQVNVPTNLGSGTSTTDVTIVSSSGSGTTVPGATTSAAGVISAADKSKLDGIATSANNYSHPNHTGEVTGSSSLTIADNVVDEANLKVSNSPTNGYVLSAESGNTGGLTWVEAGGAGAVGGGSDEVFFENGQNVTANYTITNGKNAMSAGPITINSGVTVTVGAGETWTVI